MAADPHSAALPRPLLVVGVPLAGLLLVSLFIYLGFPYDKLGDRISSEVERAGGVRIDFADLGPSLQFAGPGIRASGVRATLADGATIRLESAMLRPAWSLAWLRGMPAVYAEIASEVGNAEGTLVLGGSGGWTGELEQVDVGKLPLSGFESLGTLDGTVDATIDLLRGEKGPVGSVSFEARDGAVGLADFPMQLPYEKLTGELIFGDDAYVAIRTLSLEGPMLNADVKGNVLHADVFAEAPLRLEVEIDAKPVIGAALRSAGVRLNRNGKAKARITGTVGTPKVR